MIMRKFAETRPETMPCSASVFEANDILLTGREKMSYTI
jgi:hypothetical protein